MVNRRVKCRSNLSCSAVFSHQYFIQTTTTDFDMFLRFLMQFCNYSGFVAISDIIMLFCPQLGN